MTNKLETLTNLLSAFCTMWWATVGNVHRKQVRETRTINFLVTLKFL